MKKLTKSPKERLALLDGIAQKETSNWLADAEMQIANEGWLIKSQMIALHIMMTLKAQGITQKDLAHRMGVTPQLVNQWVKGKTNLGLDTITKIEAALGITLHTISVFEPIA
jgi:ribosome-binding protein aMBF1 (putative translation factor)